MTIPVFTRRQQALRRLHGSRMYLLILCCLVVAFVVTILYRCVTYRTHATNTGNPIFPRYDIHERSGKECYSPTNITDDGDPICMLPDVLSEINLLRDGTNIFFHDTNCLEGALSLTVRQACSIESAAKSNPHANIWTLFTSPVGIVRKNSTNSAVLKALDAYRNIRLRNLDLWQYAKGTPAEKWVLQPDLLESKYLFAHTSDFLRLLSLYKFGGTYLDLDVMVVKSFANLSQNYCGVESSNYIASGVLSFDAQHTGHFIVEQILKEFIAKFNGSVWSLSGNGVINRIMKQVCQTPTLEQCPIFNVLPPYVFYPIYYTKWRTFFEPIATEDVMAAVSNSTAIHFWNKLSAGRPVRRGEGSAYELLAQEHCPLVYAANRNDSEF